MNPPRCEICGVDFKEPRCYTAHLKSLKHKKTVDNKIENNHKCSCGKSYIHRQSLYNHQKTCQYKEDDSIQVQNQNLTKENNEMREMIHKKDQETDKMRERLDKTNREMDELRKQVETLMARGTGNTTNRNSHNNTHIETQNVIVVNSFGNENIEHLTDKIVCKLIQAGPFTCLPKIIERIHFDPEHPENHNIKVTNQKNNYAKIVKDNKWITTNKKQAIDTMIQNGYGLLEEKYQDNKESISEFKQERFEDFQEKYADQDKDLMKTIKDEVDIALLNGTGKLHKQ
jgi:hypothetical protein